MISNYEIPEADRKGQLSAGLAYRGGAERRQEIQYQNNGGDALRVSNLPWGKGEFTVTRYRTTNPENWIESETSGKAGTL